MAKEAKRTERKRGTVITTKSGLWQGVVTLPDGRRKRLPPFPKGTSRAMAEEKTAHWTEKRHELDAPKRDPRALKPSESNDPWVKTWLADRVKRGHTNTSNEATSYRKYIAPALKDKPVKDWTADDMAGLCEALDGKVQAGKISWKTAANIWGVATSMCDDACSAKTQALKVRARDDNPAKGVRGPDVGAKKLKQFLYPSEVSTFLACADVPLLWRRTVAIAVYAYLRDGELRALSWADVDLKHRTIHVHQARDATGAINATKGMQDRRFGIEPALLPLLRAMHKEAGGAGLVLPVYPVADHTARSLRAWLKRAKVERPALHEQSATRKAITFHDCRATGLTWMAVRGDDPLKIRQRAGHQDLATTQGYIRLAESVGEGFGQPFPDLPKALLSPPPGNTGQSHGGLSSGNDVEAPGIEPGSARRPISFRSRA
jgi:integrase